RVDFDDRVAAIFEVDVRAPHPRIEPKSLEKLDRVVEAALDGGNVVGLRDAPIEIIAGCGQRRRDAARYDIGFVLRFLRRCGLADADGAGQGACGDQVGVPACHSMSPRSLPLSERLALSAVPRSAPATRPRE